MAGTDRISNRKKFTLPTIICINSILMNADCVFSNALPSRVEIWRTRMAYIHLFRPSIRYGPTDETVKEMLCWDVQCSLKHCLCPAEWRLQLQSAWSSARRGHAVCSWKEEGHVWVIRTAQWWTWRISGSCLSIESRVSLRCAYVGIWLGR